MSTLYRRSAGSSSDDAGFDSVVTARSGALVRISVDTDPEKVSVGSCGGSGEERDQECEGFHPKKLGKKEGTWCVDLDVCLGPALARKVGSGSVKGRRKG